jgi:Fic family protein
MSAQIKEDRKAYYAALERTQKDSLDITSWVLWFLGCLDRALLGAERTLAAVLRRAEFWESHAAEQFSAQEYQLFPN